MKDNHERPMLGWATMKVHFVGKHCSEHCEFVRDSFRWCGRYFEYTYRTMDEAGNFNGAERCEQCVEDFGGLE